MLHLIEEDIIEKLRFISLYLLSNTLCLSIQGCDLFESPSTPSASRGMILTLEGEVSSCNTYCADIKMRGNGSSSKLGISSYYLKYNEGALGFKSLTHFHFSDQDTCWDQSGGIATFLAPAVDTTLAGVVSVTLTNVLPAQSCPELTSNEINFARVCFDIKDSNARSELGWDRKNTSFFENEGSQINTNPILPLTFIDSNDRLRCE